MPYWDIVTRSFKISWNHKYLWLIALFSGEAGGGFNFNYSQRSSRTTSAPDVGNVQQQIATWLSDHAGLVVAVVVIWLVLVVAFFLLAAVCEGATVRASAEHDAERPFGLRLAWRMGVHTMWVIVRFRLLLIALYLPLVVLIVAWFVGLVAALASHNRGATLPLALTGLLLLIVWIVYAVYLFFLDRFGTRAVVLEERAARASIARAHRLLFKRFGRALLVLLLAIGVAFVLAIVLACFSLIFILPLALLGAVAASTAPGALLPLVALSLIILVPLYLVVAGFLAAQGSTYWTLAFRRTDVDYAPAYGYPAVSPAPPQ
jgi:hypothetical protein